MKYKPCAKFLEAFEVNLWPSPFHHHTQDLCIIGSATLRLVLTVCTKETLSSKKSWILSHFASDYHFLIFYLTKASEQHKGRLLVVVSFFRLFPMRFVSY